MRKTWGVAVVAIGLAAGALPARADEASDKAEIQMLKTRLDRLEARLANQPAPGSAAPDIGDKPVSTVNLPSGLQGVQLSGYTDIAYTYSFNEANNFGNSGRVFDIESNGFTPHAAEIVLEKPMTDETPYGFRTDLFFGDDAEIFHATGLGTATDNFDLQQAYVTARVPVGEGLDLKVGKFVTLLGAEVIESPANWNYSRSYMFGYSIPFTHTGVLATYPLPAEWGSATVGMVNGWDIVDDNNKAKTFLGNVTLGPWNGVTLSSNLVSGAEQAGNSHDLRTVLSNVVSWAPNEQWAFMANADYGHEEDAIGVTATIPGSGADNASWQGYALYARYTPVERYALANRIEWFNDQDGVRVAPVPAGAALAGSGHGDVSFFEWTLTNEFKLTDHVITRLEYRFDWANAAVFRHDQGASNNQNTVAAEVIYHF